ncbi:effector-associated domain 2-containing protein [Actinomadura nitritigenes]|uniref:Effector-associated domain-containing protein n=1 Tax=Actinomadura nitritigenes TaxID=134602 RepID=A0ABS3RID4_9ACTN|nr:hypothetical protein [Actinomadura nitritigenes]MBO2445359.1 hypothetical protein [Actinomadura nitritigenes]
MAIDIVGFGDRRSDFERQHVRKALYDSVTSAFDASDISFGQTYTEDRGDGLLIIVPPQIPVEPALEELPSHLAAILRYYNRRASVEAQLKVRMAIHIGEIRHDDHGVYGSDLIHAFRLLDAPQFKEAIFGSDDALALIVSERVYTHVVGRGLGLLDPADFSTIYVRVKETASEAWVYRPLLRGWPPAAAAAGAEGRRYEDLRAEQEHQTALSELFRIVDDLLDIQLLHTVQGRDQVVGVLPPNIGKVIPRSPDPRTDLFAIMRACLDYPGGLQQFLMVIRAFAGESVAMRRLEQGITPTLMPPERPED